MFVPTISRRRHHRHGGYYRTFDINNGTSIILASSYGEGGGHASIIASGPFQGRMSGGGSRVQVVGTKQYGSGYPHTEINTVKGRGFPFVFWPLAWAGVASPSTASDLYTNEYGRFDNSSRPGGIMMTAQFTSSSSDTAFHLLADQTTVQQLVLDIVDSCHWSIQSSFGSIVITPYNDSISTPKPEEVIQYYRASSVALSLHGYNNTVTFWPDIAQDTALNANTDMELLNCLNSTIAKAVPLVEHNEYGAIHRTVFGEISWFQITVLACGLILCKIIATLARYSRFSYEPLASDEAEHDRMIQQ